jgi:hypothetical protein
LHIRWTRKQLRSNRQSVLVCTHFEIKQPWVLYPYLVHRYEGSIRGTIIWHPGPCVRECCIEALDGHALSHWWWTVEQRFRLLKLEGLEDQEITKALLEQLDFVECILEEVVPKPTRGQMRGYLDFREDLGLPNSEIKTSRKNSVPTYAKILGFDTWPCTLGDLKKRWKELALKHHPDRNGDIEKFRLCQQAYLKAQDYLTEKQPNVS